MPSLSELVRYRTSENGDSVTVSIKGGHAEHIRVIGATCPHSMDPPHDAEAFAFYPKEGIDGFVVFAVTYSSPKSRRFPGAEFFREYRWRNGVPVVLDEPYCSRPSLALPDGYYMQLTLPDGRKVSNVPHDEDVQDDRILVPLQGGTEAICRYAYEQSDENLTSLLEWAGDPDAKRQAAQINEVERLRRRLADREEVIKNLSQTLCRAKNILAMLWTRVTGTPFPSTFFEDFPDGEITKEGLDEYMALKTVKRGVVEWIRRFLFQVRMTS